MRLWGVIAGSTWVEAQPADHGIRTRQEGAAGAAARVGAWWLQAAEQRVRAGQAIALNLQHTVEKLTH